MEKAFDRVGHQIIIPAPSAIELPEILIIAMQHHTLVVGLCWAQWKERNFHHHQNWQWASDPLSSILFSHAIDPLNHHLATAFMKLKCIQWKRGCSWAIYVYAYDNLTPLALAGAEQPWPVLSRENTGASAHTISYRHPPPLPHWEDSFNLWGWQHQTRPNSQAKQLTQLWKQQWHTLIPRQSSTWSWQSYPHSCIAQSYTHYYCTSFCLQLHMS